MKRQNILALGGLLVAALALVTACTGTFDLAVETTPGPEATLAALEAENARLTTQVATMATPTAVAVEAEEVAREKTAGWQIHRNKKHGYFFMYPLDCFYGPMPVHCKEKPPEDRPPECLCFLSGENPDDVGLQAYTGEKSELTLASFSVYCDGNPDYFAPPPDTELIAWLKEKFSDLHKDIPDEPNMEIDGLPAVRIYAPQSAQAYSDERIYFIRNDRLFRIQMLNPDAESNRELYDQILSTFGFED